MGTQSTMVATWIASQPTVPDLSCGFQFHFSSGQRSSVLRVFCISWSNSGSIDCPMVITASLAKFEIRRRDTRRTKGELSRTFSCFLDFRAPAGELDSHSGCEDRAKDYLGLADLRWSKPMGLTKVEVRRKWRYGAPIHDFVFEGFHRRFSILQKAGRTRDGAMPG